MPKMLKRTHYHQWGIAKQDANVGMPVPGRKFYGLRDTVKLLGHDDLDVIDVFKIDCELCEWDTYVDWLADGIPLLHQIQVETHGVPGEKALGFFDTLEAVGYLRYHKEANILLKEQFRKFGQCFEFGMVKVRPPAAICLIFMLLSSQAPCQFYLCTKVSTEFMNGKEYTFNKEKFRMVHGKIVKY
jgi:hypothetical protein